MEMDIAEIRRQNLLRWVAEHGTPARERSLFSQLKSTGSFGERVARRLETAYKMGAGYLDAQGADVAPVEKDVSSGGLADSMKLTCETAKELKMLSVYRLANEDQRRVIDSAVENIRVLLDLRVRDQG